MENYSLQNLVKEEYFNELCKFFNEELFGENELNNKNWDSIIFISRKAYCLFLLLQKNGFLRTNDCQIYSDRFVMKTLNRNMFKNEKVCLVDDTITTGKHMLDVCKIIKRRTGCQDLSPLVFAADNGFEKSYAIMQLQEECNKSVQPRVKWNASEILRFCTIETLVMYQEKIPYAIELPILSEKNSDYIHLTKEQYHTLMAGNKKWSFFSSDESGYLQNNIKYGIDIMRDDSIAEFMANYVYKFCVRLQITESDSEYDIVAIPFAVLKSVNFDELHEFFTLLYKGTSYYEAVERYINENNENYAEDIYVALYRGVVFNLSEYIGYSFVHYLKVEVLNRDNLSLHECNKKQNFDESFCQSTDEIYKNKRLEIERLWDIINYHGFSKVSQNSYLKRYVNKFIGLSCDYKTMSLYLLALINEMRFNQDNNVLMIEAEQKEKFITIEDLQATLYMTYPNEEQSKIDDLLLMCICNMLGQSKLANEIYYEKNSNVIYRGFKYGENSEALLDLSAKVFYVAVKQYYDLCTSKDDNHEEKSLYASNYDLFLKTFKMFLLEHQLYGSLMTKDEFRIYSEMFRERNKEHLRKTIENKEFIGEEDKFPYYLLRLKNYIADANIYN